MAINFDRSCMYQMGVFFERAAEPSNFDDVAILFAPETPATSLGLRFSPPVYEQAFFAEGDGPILPGRTVTWKAGGVWRLVWSAIRADLYFDARAYADLLGEDVVKPLSDVCRRALDPLSKLGDALGRRTHRLVLNVAGVGSKDACHGDPGKIISKAFFKESVKVVDGADMIARVNHIASWKVGDKELRINRVETAQSNWQLRDGKEDLSLTWTLDANTSPIHSTDATFSPADIMQFFGQAEPWASERLAAIAAL